MNLDSPILPLRAALRRMSRPVAGTRLKSAEIADLGAQVTEQAFFSAQNLLDDVLAGLKSDITSILNPTTEPPEGGTPNGRTVGMDPATARLKAKEALRKIGYEPEPGKAGTIEDLSSNKRINLVVDFNQVEAAGYGQYLEGNDPEVLDLFPCQELIRVEARKEPRAWDVIWPSACAEAGDAEAARVFRQTGRMIARKDSGVWLAISDFGRPWPPFKFGSGMGLMDVDRQEAMALGLIDLNTQVAPGRAAFNEGPSGRAPFGRAA
jgi:hypothetical protein